MFAWSSLSRTSHLSSAGTTMRRARSGCVEPLVHPRVRRRHHREECVLVDDALVERRRLEEDARSPRRARRSRQRRRDLGSRSADIAFMPSSLERRPQRLGSSLFVSTKSTIQIDAVLLELRRVRGREVQRDVRRVRPVEHPRRQAVVLARARASARALARDRVRAGVLAEAAEQVTLDVGVVAAEPLQARHEARRSDASPRNTKSER